MTEEPVSRHRTVPPPRIDIVMPYYGDVPMMQGAVRSVLAQTDPRWRLTVIDDGQEPGVPEWFAELSAGEPRVRYDRNERNLGITRNFQKSLGTADAEFVAMIGCDDELLPDYVATMLAVYDAHPEVAMAQPGVEVIDATGAVVTPLVDRMKRNVFAPRVRGVQVMEGEKLAASLLRGNWMYFPAICWRTEAIQAVGFDQAFTVVQDLNVTLSLIKAGEKLALSDHVSFRYRRHPASQSSTQATDGTRFDEERDFFLAEADRMKTMGWNRASRAGRRHLASRLHAAALTPSAARRGDVAGLGRLAGFALLPARRRG
ncbi:glycosyltransferase family 2 protein [Catenulispora pinistramenti]|nr:glycosyltransferase [Catenulispora pinistramenti]